jgi:hypothetical protein
MTNNEMLKKEVLKEMWIRILLSTATGGHILAFRPHVLVS